MPDQPRPTFGDVQEWLSERHTILDPAYKAMADDEDWFDAGTDDNARARVAALIPGLPKAPHWKTQLIPLAYLGTMVGVNEVYVGETIEVRWHIPETIFDEDGTVLEGPGYTEQERKQRERVVSRWLTAIVNVIDTYGTDSIVREEVTKLIGLGMGAVSYSIAYDRYPEPPFGYARGKKRKEKEPRADASEADKKKWEDYRRAKARTFPFELVPIHPTTLFFDPHHQIPYDYIREEKITRSAAEKYPEWAGAQLGSEESSSNATNDVTRITYVSPKWRGQWLGGVSITKASAGYDVVDGITANTSGLPLHRMAFGGFGSNNRSGSFTSKAKGIIRDGRDLIAMKIEALNKVHRIEGVTAFPPLQVVGPDPIIRAALEEKLNYGSGEVLSMPDGYSIKEFPEIKIPQSLFQQNDMVDQLLEQHFGPKIQRGAAQPGETYRGQQSRQSIAAAIYSSARQAGQQMFAAVLTDLLALVKYELRERCPVMGGDSSVVSITPDDIDDGGWAVVDFTPATEEEKAFKREGLTKDMANGAITPQEFAEELGYDDPEAHVRSVRVQSMIDRWLQSPEAMAIFNSMVAPPMPGVDPSALGRGAPTPSGMPTTETPPAGGNGEQAAATASVNGVYAPVR